MNAMLKRFISLMLCFIMVAGYLPVGALAEETGTVQEPSDDTAVVVEEESADADEKVLVESEWILPECDCGSTETELGKHEETCARKVFLEEFCEETAADIFAKWEKLPEECQKYILEYLSRDEADAEKLAELKGYVDAARTEPTEEATEESVEETGAPAEPLMTLATGDSVTVIAGSDFQYNVNNVHDHNQGANLVTTFLNKIKESHTYVNGFLFCGDYDYGYYDSANGKAALQTAVLNVYGNNGLTEDKMIWVQGNHDPDELVGGVLSSSGAHNADEYGVYVINEKDYMWYNNDEATIKKTAAALETYLDAKVAAKYTKPIFVVSHLPLHYSMRTASDGDCQYANYIFDVLNEAGADGLNIIFLFGHNHSNGWDDYLGGSAVYLAKGDSINIAQSSKKNFATKKLNFTYMNAGYVAYYSTPTSGAETDLSMTVFQITDDTVTVTRYIAGGSHDLKSAGVKNTTKGDTFEPDTRVISSPQTITLNKTFKATATSAETGVSVSGMGITGMTVEKVEQDVPTGYSAYATYDITPTGFAGGAATVTIEVDDSFDASRSVTVIDVETGDTQICQIVNGKVTFTTTHFSLYTVAQTEADTASGKGTLEKYLKQITSVNDLETGVPYIISDYSKEWVLTNITGTTAKKSYPGLVLDGTPSVDTPYLWYINEDGYLVYGSADSALYLLVGSGVSGSRTTSIGALTESNAGFAATIVTYSGTDFNIENAGGTGFLNRYGGQPTDNVATSYIDTVGGSGNSYWHIYQLVSDAAVTMTINASSTTITEGGTSKLTPVVTVGGASATSYEVRWASSDTSVATVNTSGEVTPVKMGQTTVTATLTKANGITLTEPIVAEILITVVSVKKDDVSVTASTTFNNVVLIENVGTLLEKTPYVVVSHISDYILTGNMVATGMELLPEYSGSVADLPVWYVEKGDDDTEYLRFGSLSATDNYLVHDGKVALGAQSTTYIFDQLTEYSASEKTFFIWISTYDGSNEETPASLNQYGGATSTVAGLFTRNAPSHSCWRFHEVIKNLSLSVSPSSDLIYPGDTATLTPTVMVNGRAVSGNTISWYSSNKNVATVSNGVVTAKKSGNVTITATLTAADGTSLGTSVSVEIPIQVIDVTESDGTVTSTVTVEKKMSPVAELVAGTASGPYIITNKGTSVVLTGNMMTKDNPAYNGNGGKVGLELSKYNDFSELWYFDGTYLRYGSANGPYLTLADDQVSLSDSAKNAANILTLNGDGLSYTITSKAVMENSKYTLKYMNHYGGGSHNVVYYWSQDGNANDGSAWYFNTITPERTATISLTPSPTTVYEGQNTVLTPAITLDGVNQTAYKLKWSSSDETVATVYQGKVTGTAAGNAKIRATVNSINGEKFQTEICVEASVTVIGIEEIKLTGNGSVSQRASAKADTGTNLYIKYTDGTEDYVPITVNMLTDSNGKRVSTYNAASYTGLTVNYGSHKVGGFNLTVVAPDKPDYPAYPAEGSVFVDKTGTGVDFQSSGVAQIELTAGGIPSKTGADVIIMLDTSSSMNNQVGGTTITRIQVLTESLNNLLNQLQQKDASGNQMDVRVAVADFNGYYYNYPDSPYYVEATDTTVGNSIRSDPAYQVSSNAIFTGTKDLTAGAFVDVHDIGQNPFTCENYTGKTSGKYTLYTHSGTNYDYAFDAIYQLAEAVNEANSTGEARDLFVIFMSDGAPFQFNYFSSQSNLSGSANWNNWLTGSFTPDVYATNANTTYYHSKGLHWMAEAIKGDPTEDYPVIRKNDERDTDHDNWITLPGLGATMYSIGFCLALDNKITVDAMDTVIRNIASDSKYYFRADTADELSDAFNLITNEVFYAASEARFIDEMGVDYDLLMGTQTYKDRNIVTQTIESVIEVKSYSTWTYDDLADGKCAANQVGNRKTNNDGSFIYTLLEKVTFNSAGTVAYSNKLSASDNILKNGVICANTFWYNTNKYVDETNTGAVAIDTNGDGTTDYTLPAETFYWKLGTVSNAQMTLSYYVYLEDCGVKSDEEPGVPAGIYDTNERAEMYYVNYLGNDCVQSVETPRLPWQQATVGYGFYLVNSDGNPIVNQSTGEIGSFERAVKITQPVYKDFLLNTGSDIIAEIVANGKLPEGYKLFDEGAEYSVKMDSNGSGSYTIVVTAEDGKQTTYVVGVEKNAVTGNGTTETTNYTTANTVVWFGVVANVKCVPDTIVIDYGQPVNINVLANDLMIGEYGTVEYIDRRSKITDLQDYKDAVAADRNLEMWEYLQSLPADSTSKLTYDTYRNGSYGKLTITDKAKGMLQYTLSTMLFDQTPDYFVYAVKYNGPLGTHGYYYSTLTVIPATTIYYEDSFEGTSSIDSKIEYKVYDFETDEDVTGSTDAKYKDYQWGTAGTLKEPIQGQDRPGEYSFPELDANNIYGYDPSYSAFGSYSGGQCTRLKVNKDVYATATFTFWGTGFDIISMTSKDTGTILVDVYKHSEYNPYRNGETDVLPEPVESHFVDLYYGYKYAKCDVVYEYIKDVTTGEYFWDKNVGSETTADEKDPAYPSNPKDGDTVSAVEYCWIPAPDDSVSTDHDYIYQVPAMKVDGLTYGKYTVVITISYKAGLDHNPADACYYFYMDAVRIYDPGKDGANADVRDAYLADGEGWPEYFELRNLIISKNDFNSNTSGTGRGIIFIDNKLDTSNKEAYTIEDYMNYGPNNELYLAPGQAVAFKLNVDHPDLAQIHLAMKKVDAEVTVKVYDAEDKSKTSVTPTSIETSTDLYYDISSLNGKTVVIQNTNTSGGAILSITNIKVTYKAEHTDSLNNSYFTASAAVAETALLSLRTTTPSMDSEIPETTVPETTVPETTVPETTVPETTVPETTVPETTVPETTVPETTVPETTVPETTVPEETEPEETVPEETETEATEPEAFEPKRFNVRLSDTSVKVGSKVTVTVTTGTDVDCITVNGVKVSKYSGSRYSSTRTWQVRVEAEEVGQMDVAVVCYNSENLASQPIVRTVTVTKQYTSITNVVKDLITGFFDRLWGSR